MGQENRIGWLCKPLGPTTLLAKEQPDLLEGASPRRLIDRMQSDDPNVRFTADGKTVKIQGKKDNSGKTLVFGLSDIPCPSEDLTIYLIMHGEPMAGHPMELARLVRVIAKGKPYDRVMMSFINKNSFQSAFYFNSTHNISPDKTPVTLHIEVEGTEPIWISDIRAYAHPDARVRAFENGVVLLNHAPHPYSFDLQELFKQQEFRRLKGSSEQDPITNDGSKAEGKVELQVKDALFLVRMK